MAHEKKTRIRIISSRGHYYAQEVQYEWDKFRKRPRTHVFRTLGPVQSGRRLPGRMAPEEIQELWKAQREQQLREAFVHKEQSPPLKPKVIPEVAAQPAPGIGLATPKSSARTGSGTTRQGRSLTGQAGLEDFDGQVLDLIRQIQGFVTRRMVTKAVLSAGIDRPNHHQSIRRHVSFSLTRLHTRGMLTRKGMGGRGKEYNYHLKPAADVAQEQRATEAETGTSEDD
jgi:hypothetical protein